MPEDPLRRAVAVCLAAATLSSPTQAAPSPPDHAAAETSEPAPPPTEGSVAAGTDEHDMVDRAMHVFRRGSENYALGRYEQALADFQEAASLYASPDFQYNIGLCYEKLGQLDEAIRSFSTYLRAKPDASDREAVQARIEHLAAEREAQRRAREAEERARQEAAARQAAPPPASVARDAGTPPLVTAGAVLTGLGAALAIGGGTAFGVLASRKSDELDAVYDGNPGGLDFEQARALESEGQRLEVGQIVCTSLGAALAVSGVAMLAVGASRARRQAMARRFGPTFTSGSGLAVRF